MSGTDDDKHERDPLREARIHLRLIAREAREQARLGGDRLSAKLRAGRQRLVLLLWIGLAGSVATIATTFYLVRGVVGLAASLTGSAWAGDLLGAGALALVAGSAYFALRLRRETAHLAALRAKYEAPVDEEVSARGAA